ncbi:MAG TPA: DUF5666 domain-containing protein [Ktedonobacterales bacterium]
MGILRSRVGLAVVGLLLVGSISAAIAMLTAPHSASPTLNAITQRGATATATHTGKTDTATATTQAVATNTTASQPTSPPAPTAQPTPTFAPGQSVDVSGKTANVTSTSGGGTFTLRTRNGSFSIVVNGSTSFSGTARDMATLQNDWNAEVHGIVQNDGSILATEVNANPDN